MSWLEHRIPPPLWALAFALLAWGAAPAAAREGVDAGLRIGLAVAVALAGGAVSGAGSLGFRRARTTVNPLRPEKASALVTGGIYRRTRNPMYVGMTLVLVGVAVWLWWGPALLAPAGFVAVVTRLQIVPEERALAAKFGDAYADYCRRVRRWI